MSEEHPRPVIAQAPISVILFSHALATQTEEALRNWQHYLGALRRPHEILLIQETRPEVPPTPQASRTFFYERAIGHREALNEAIRVAKHPLIAFCTCDLQYQPNDLEHLLKLIDQVDMVVGYRVGKPVPYWRLLFDTVTILFARVLLGIPLAPTVCWLGSEGWARRWLSRWIFGLRLNDPECPFRLARHDIVQAMPLQAKGSFVQIEMLAKANHLGRLIGEEPVTWLPTTAPTPEADSFSDDAWVVFRDPQFVYVR